MDTILIHRYSVHTNTKIMGIMQPTHLNKWAEIMEFTTVQFDVPFEPVFHAQTGMDITVSDAFNKSTVTFIELISFE